MLEVKVDRYENSWEFWVYPKTLPEISTEGIYICNELNKQAENILNNGGKVLLLGAGKVELGKEVVQYFKPVFWNTSWFRMRPPHTLGILCDPDHPVFRNFPTEYHSNFQWWSLINRQQVMILDKMTPELRPLIQPIDTWFLNRRLGMLFEVRIGKGKLMVCSIDLEHNMEDRPAARQFMYSLIHYMQSDEFKPANKIDIQLVKNIFTPQESKSVNFHTREKAEDL